MEWPITAVDATCPKKGEAGSAPSPAFPRSRRPGQARSRRGWAQATARPPWWAGPGCTLPARRRRAGCDRRSPHREAVPERQQGKLPATAVLFPAVTAG